MQVWPRVRRSGDRAVVVEFGDGIDDALNARVHRAARALLRLALPGVREVVPTYRSFTIHIDPLTVAVSDVDRAVAALDLEDRASPATGPDAPKVVEIPVVYGGEYGPDLDEVARHCGMSPGDVVTLHASTTYRVFMMGFTPGFPYLGGMSPRLATPRLATPRTVVPAGSVGIAGQQTGVYPTASPGGWRLIGRTPLRLFDPVAEPPCVVDAGDHLRFVPITAEAFAQWPEQPSHQATAEPSAEGVEVLEGGVLTTVQDLGRHGYQRYGVPVAGAMDTVSLRLANRLVGNADDLAGLEMTLAGPMLRFDADAVVAMAGAEFGARLNGRRVPNGRTVRVRRGDVLSCGTRGSGTRAYLAIGGGIPVPVVLRSRSTYLASAFGGWAGRALRAGDRLPLDRAGRLAPVTLVAPEPPAIRTGSPRRVRVVMGPQADAFTDIGRATFLSAPYTLSSRSDRVGCRFEGPRIEHAASPDVVSDGTTGGAIQVSGDGQPIVLMADRGTTGGYARIATVISADLPVVAQMAPGEHVSFVVVTFEDALQALRDQEAWLGRVVEASGRSDDVFDEDAGAPWAADGAAALAAALAGREAASGARPAGIVAGMAGLVVAVMVRAGTPVAERETLVVIEAMKMQNPVRAPRAGRVARVLVEPGSQVHAGATVVELED